MHWLLLPPPPILPVFISSEARDLKKISQEVIHYLLIDNDLLIYVIYVIYFY